MRVANPDHQSFRIPILLWLMHAWFVFNSAGSPSHGTTLARNGAEHIGRIWCHQPLAILITPRVKGNKHQSILHRAQRDGLRGAIATRTTRIRSGFDGSMTAE